MAPLPPPLQPFPFPSCQQSPLIVPSKLVSECLFISPSTTWMAVTPGLVVISYLAGWCPFAYIDGVNVALSATRYHGGTCTRVRTAGRSTRVTHISSRIDVNDSLKDPMPSVSSIHHEITSDVALSSSSMTASRNHIADVARRSSRTCGLEG